MFKQVKSAFFWYYLYKFRRRVVLVVLLLIVALFANAIYSDIVEYLKLKDKLQYLEIVLTSKWLLILFNITFSVYLILTMFKKEENLKENNKNIKKDLKKEIKKESQKINDEIKENKKTEKFTDREKEFLYKKKLKNKADMLVDK